MPPTTTARLLVACPDRRGIIAAATTFVAQHGGNVIDLQQHTDHTDEAFFQRVEFELDGVDLGRDELGAAFEPIAERFAMRWALRFSDHRPRVGLLASSEAHCVYDLLHRWREGELAVDIPVRHQQPPRPRRRRGLVRCRARTTSRSSTATRRRRRPRCTRCCGATDVDLVVLARYMQILSPEFCDEWAERIINIHHSFLPAFRARGRTTRPTNAGSSSSGPRPTT